MTGFQRCGITGPGGGPGGGTWRIKWLKALVLQGLRALLCNIEALLCNIEALVGGKAGGEGRSGGGGSALKRRSPTVITILKHPRKLDYCDREQLEGLRGITGSGGKIKNRFYYLIYYHQTQSTPYIYI